MSSPSLVEKVLAISRSMRRIPHAFGGALALAYYAEPRATIDIDLNVFVGASRFGDVARALSAAGAGGDVTAAAELVERDGQARVFWDSTPIDLFFAYDPFHDDAAAHTRAVPFAGASIRVLGPEHLVVCKAIYNRPRDWVDIEALLELGTPVDAAIVLRWVGRIAGDEDPRFARSAAVLTRRSP